MHDDSPASDVLDRLEKAEQLKLTGHYEEAIEILERLLLDDPQNIAALEELADNELSLEHYERAEVAARQAVQLDDNSYTGYYILGFLSSFRQQWETAVEDLKKANALRPNNPEILRCLGWALFNMGQRAQGIVTLERALNLDDENVLTLCDLGVAYLQSKNVPKAKLLFTRALELEPDSERAQECTEAIIRLEQAMKVKRMQEQKKS